MLRRIQSLRGEWQPTNYSHRLLIPDSSICVVNDVRIPFHDESLLAEMLENCQQYAIHSLVWLGNVVDVGAFGGIFGAESIFNGILTLVSDVVEFQYWAGGHRSVVRKSRLDGLVDSGKLIVSDSPFIEADERRWLICHPNKSSEHPFDFARQLIPYEQKSMLVGTSQRWGMLSVGKYLAVNSGGLLSPDLIDYTTDTISQGYWFLINGEPIGFRHK